MKMPEISRQQKQYLARQKKEKHIILAARTLLFVLFMGLWEISSDLGWIDSFIFSSPSLIAKTFLSMCRDQSLFAHIAVTLAETLVSFFFGVILGVGTAVLLWCSRRIARILEPCLVVLNSLPKSALAPLLIVWLGANERTIVVAGMSVPLILSVMKVNIGLCLVGVIIGEFIGARKGLGYLIIYGSQTFRLTWVLMSIVILCIIAMLLYFALYLIEKQVRKH